MTDTDKTAADQRAPIPQDADLDDPSAGLPPDALTGLRADHESDAYGIDLRAGGDIVQSDTVGAAELSAEYTADHATEATRADPQDTLDAWSQAAEDAQEPTEI